MLLTNTAVPLWQSMHRTLPVFFMASATAVGADGRPLKFPLPVLR